MEPQNFEIERILVRGTNWIGDAVMSAPALRRLRTSFPGAHITLLAPPRTAELFEDSPYLDELFPYHRSQKGVSAFFDAVKSIRRRDIDLAVLFQNAFEAALLTMLGGVPLRIGFAEQGRSAMLTHRLRRGAQHRGRHQVHDYLDIVAECERACMRTPAPEPPQSLPVLTASPRQIEAARELLPQAGTESSLPLLITLNAGATNSQAKQWPPERFAALADRLTQTTGGRIALIGAASERETAQNVIDCMKTTGAQNLAGKSSMPALLGLLALSDLVVSNDTGPAHISAALGRPTLTLFGPTNEFETAPMGRFAELIRVEGIECARCMHRECPIDHRCMTRLSPDDVFERAIGLLGRGGSRSG
jgi:heptosyltransferase II